MELSQSYEHTLCIEMHGMLCKWHGGPLGKGLQQ